MQPTVHISSVKGYLSGLWSSAMARGKAAEERRAQRREELLQCSIDAIREHGATATMDQLARAGGVTKPILYRHFVDRDGLITAIAESFATSLAVDIDTALQTTQQAEALLESSLDAYMAFVEMEPELYRFLLHQTTARAPGMSPISPLVDGIARRVALVIRAQLEFAGMDESAAYVWAYGVVGMVHQAGDWWLDEGTLPRSVLTKHLSTLIWHGVSAAVPAGLHTPTTT